MLDILIPIAVVLILAILGAVLFSGRGAFLIAGYNTMSKEERAQFDEKKLCRAVGMFLFVLDALLGFVLWSGITGRMAVFAVAMILFFAAFIVGTILINRVAKK